MSDKYKVIDATIAGNLEAVARGSTSAWSSLELFVFPNERKDDPYIATRRQIWKTSEITLCDWQFVRITPAQLRQLADELERRQG